MNKQAPTLMRLLTMVLFALSCFGLLLFLWLAFGGTTPLQPKGYRVQVGFHDAATLADEADVRTAGVTIGRVVQLDLAPGGGRTLATLELDSEFAPLRSDARAMLRQKTLLGETYVELTLGKRGSQPLKEGARLPDARVAEAVEFDELLTLFDADTRRAFQQWQRSSAKAGAGRGDDLNAVLGRFPGFVGGAEEVFSELRRRDEALRGLVRGTGKTFAALNRNGEALQDLVRQNATVMQSLAGRRDAIADTFAVLPTFLRESRATLTRVQRTSEQAEPLLRDLEPVLEDVQPTLRSLRRLSPDLQKAFAALPALRKAGDDGLPALSRILRGLDPALAAADPFLRQITPLVRFLELYQTSLTDFLNIGPSALAVKTATTPGSKSNGHALPQLIVLGNQTLPAERRTANNRGNAYFSPDALVDPRIFDPTRFILPNFDCDHVGEKAPDSTPGCFAQNPFEFQGRLSRFPQVREAPRP